MPLPQIGHVSQRELKLPFWIGNQGYEQVSLGERLCYTAQITQSKWAFSFDTKYLTGNLEVRKMGAFKSHGKVFFILGTQISS